MIPPPTADDLAREAECEYQLPVPFPCLRAGHDAWIRRAVAERAAREAAEKRVDELEPLPEQVTLARAALSTVGIEATYFDDCVTAAVERIAGLEKRVAELEAIIAKHDLCHDLHGKVGQAEFEEGCRRETVKEFGSCGWADRIAELEAALAEKRAAVAELLRLRQADVELAAEFLKCRPERVAVDLALAGNELHIADLQKVITGLAARVEAQSELLAKRAEAKGGA